LEINHTFKLNVIIGTYVLSCKMYILVGRYIAFVLYYLHKKNKKGT